MAADPSEHVAQAKLLIAERRYQDAVRALRRALVAKPDHIEARLLLGTTLLALERYDEVRAEMLALSRKAPTDARVQRLLGEAFLRGGKLDKAVEALRKALELDPDDDPARELLAEAGEEVPPRSRTMERWFDPEQVATVQTSAPEFVEEATGPHVALPDLPGAPTSIVVDAAFQRAIDEAGSSEVTRPPESAQRRRPSTLIGVPSPLVPPAEPSPVRRPKATILGMPSPVAGGVPPSAALPRSAALPPKSAAAPAPSAPKSAEPSTSEIELPRDRTSYAPPRPDAVARRPASIAPPAPRPAAAPVAPAPAATAAGRPAPQSAADRPAPQSAAAPPRPARGRRDVTEQIDLGQLEDMENAAADELDMSELTEDSTGARPPLAPGPAPKAPPFGASPPAPPAARPVRVSTPPPPATPSSSVAGPPPRGFAAAVGPLPLPLPPVSAFPSPPAFESNAASEVTAPAIVAPPPRASSAGGYAAPMNLDSDPSEDRTNVRVASPVKGKSRALPIAVGVAVLLVATLVGTLGVRALMARRRSAAIAALVVAAEADGRPATLASAIAAIEATHDDDAESVALLARLEATGVLEQARDPARATALAARLVGEDAQLTNAQLARAYLLLARGEIDGARRAAMTLSASDELASEAARARALTAFAAGDLVRAIAEARVSVAAAPGAARPSALLAMLLARSGDAASALSTLEGVPGASLSPAVRLTRARVLLARRGAGDREAAAREAAEVLGTLASSTTPPERAGAHLVQAEVALAAGDLVRAASEVREAQPAPADEAFGLAHADVLAATGASTEARTVLAALPPTSSDPQRRARVTATVALATNDLDGAERAIAQAGSGGAIDLLRGRIAEARGRTDEAKSLYERVPLDDVAMPAARTRLAAILLAAGRVRQASDALAPASERLPTDVDVVTLWARIRLELRDVAGARAALQRALAAGAGSLRLLAMKAEVELAAGDVEAAITTLRGAIALAPSDATLQVSLARAQRRAGRAAESRAAADAALQLDPASADALLVLAELATDGGDVAAANTAIARAEATGRAPAADLARARMRVLVATGAGAAGVAAAETIARASRDASLFVALGRLHAQAEQDDEAGDAFNQAVRLDPRDAEAWVGKVFLALRRGDLRGAGRGLEKAIELADARAASPELRARIETARGRLRFESGSFAEARERADAAIALDPRSAEAQLLLANIAIEQGGDPIPALRSAVGGIAPPGEAIGRLALRLPRGDEACAAARRYLETAPRGYDAEAVREVADRCR